MKSTIKRLVSFAGYEVERKHPLRNKTKKIYAKYRDFTMIPEELFIDNLELVWNYRHVPGCIVECGVWRGGMSAGMASILPDREFFLFDSFEGLPEAKEIDGERAQEWQQRKDSPGYYNNCSAEIQIAESALRTTGVQFYLVKGWFNETLARTKLVKPISVLRLDADWYESTWECLTTLYPLVANGGLVIFDDYYTWDGCSRAVHDYLSKYSLTSRIHKTKKGVPYLVKQN